MVIPSGSADAAAAPKRTSTTASSDVASGSSGPSTTAQPTDRKKIKLVDKEDTPQSSSTHYSSTPTPPPTKHVKPKTAAFGKVVLHITFAFCIYRTACLSADFAPNLASVICVFVIKLAVFDNHSGILLILYGW